MDSQAVASAPVEVRVENVGGIDQTSVSLAPGTTVLAGRNATNRTSFLQALMAALGSDQATLKGDADEGRVTLTIGEETYERTLRRRGGSVVFGGTPYLEDAEVADLFAFLLESNEARRAVARGDDLRDLIMRPVDTEEIRAEIDRLEAEKRQIDGRAEELDRLADRLPDLEARRRELEAAIEEKRDALEEAEAAVASADEAVAESREGRAELETRLDELKEARSSLETIRFQLETERDSLEALADERAELEAELDALPAHPGEAVEELEAELTTLRERRSAIDSRVDEIHTIVEFNREMLEGTSGDIARALRGENEASPAEQLAPGADEVTCWTCGSSVDRAQIEATIERLQDLRRETAAEREAIRAKIEDRSAERAAIDDRRDQRTEIERRLDQIEAERSRREAAIEDLRERRETLVSEVERLEADIESVESDIDDELLSRHREANELEFELDRLEEDLESVAEEIADVEDALDDRDALEAEREQLTDALASARNRIETIERESVEAFNEHMAGVLERLEYDNLSRVWIERTEREVPRGRGTTREPSFDLHIVRTTDAGTTYEDTVDHLSESEREVTGLVFALAGYLVHEVHEELPFILLDSLEAIDSDRIATLIDYLGEYAGYLVAALLPEDAAAVEDPEAVLTEI